MLSDSSFTEFLPELHRPLSLLQAGPLHLEVAAVLPWLGSRLLVHYCLAYTQTPNPAWMLLYHRCLSQSPPDPSQPPLRLTIPHSLFLAPPTSSRPPSDGTSNMEDTEVFFLCHSQVCSDAAADCSLHCTRCESYTCTRMHTRTQLVWIIQHAVLVFLIIINVLTGQYFSFID